MEEVKLRLETEPDFVNLKRYGYSLERVMDRYPDGVPDRLVAQALCMSEEEVEEFYEEVVLKLREKIRGESSSSLGD